MKTVILDGMNKDFHISEALCQNMKSTQRAYSYYALGKLKIEPCRSCGVCGHKTPGECFIKDDMPPILRDIANSDTIVMLTPITFGGYSSQLKKAVDKFMVLGEAMYIVKDGHMLHPMRYGHKKMVVAGVEVEHVEEQRESFERLVAHNALNMNFSYRTFFLKPTDKEIIRKTNMIVSEVTS